MWSTPSLPLLPDLLGVVVLDRIPFMDQMEQIMCKQMTGVKLWLSYSNNWNHLTVCKKELRLIYECYLQNVFTNHFLKFLPGCSSGLVAEEHAFCLLMPGIFTVQWNAFVLAIRSTRWHRLFDRIENARKELPTPNSTRCRSSIAKLMTRPIKICQSTASERKHFWYYLNLFSQISVLSLYGVIG